MTVSSNTSLHTFTTTTFSKKFDKHDRRPVNSDKYPELAQAGFTYIVVPRKNGKGKDKYYYSPTDKEYNSIPKAKEAALSLLNAAKSSGSEYDSDQSDSVVVNEPPKKKIAVEPKNLFDTKPAAVEVVTAHSLTANEEDPVDLLKLVADSAHRNKVDVAAINQRAELGYEMYFPGRSVNQNVDDAHFKELLTAKRLVPLRVPNWNQSSIAEFIAVYFDGEGIKSLNTKQKVLAFVKLFAKEGKLLASAHSANSVAIVQEWIEEEETQMTSSSVHSIEWYNDLLYTLSLMLHTELIMVLPPDGRNVKGGCRLITMPQVDYATQSVSNPGALFIRLIINRSIEDGPSDGGTNVVGASAYCCERERLSDGTFARAASNGDGWSASGEDSKQPSNSNHLATTSVDKDKTGFVYKTPDKVQEKQVSNGKFESSDVGMHNEVNVKPSTVVTASDVSKSSSETADVGNWPKVMNTKQLASFRLNASPGRAVLGSITVEVSSGFTNRNTGEMMYLLVINLGKEGWFIKAPVIIQCCETYFSEGSDKPASVYIGWKDQFIRQIQYGPDKLHRRQLRPYEAAGTVPYPTTRLTTVLAVNPKGHGLPICLKKFEDVLKRMFSDGTYPAHFMFEYMVTNAVPLYNGFIQGKYRSPPNKGKPFQSDDELKESLKESFQTTFKRGFGRVEHGMKLDKFLPDIAIKSFLLSLGYTSFDDVSPDERANLYRSGNLPVWDAIVEEGISG